MPAGRSSEERERCSRSKTAAAIWPAMTLPIHDASSQFSGYSICIIQLDFMNFHTHSLDHLPNSRVETALRNMQAQGVWNGSFNGRESTLQQLAPFVGKLKTGMANTLIEHFSRPGDWVCDPLSGCGSVPLEAVLLGRKAKANDLSPYALCVTRGKLDAPPTLAEAESRCTKLLEYVDRHWKSQDLRRVDHWVRAFFHPRTLKETLVAFKFCRNRRDWFLAACLCGILHHQRPGFLSYPASHMVPYLRTTLFPPEKFPELYEYRPLADRLRKKVKRAYRRHNLPSNWAARQYEIRSSCMTGPCCTISDGTPTGRTGSRARANRRRTSRGRRASASTAWWSTPPWRAWGRLWDPRG